MLLQFLNQCFCNRRAWLLIIITTSILEVLVLWFQYGFGYKPCILCVYERCALFGVMGAGLIGIIAPKTSLRYIALFIWLYSAWKGVELSWRHNIITQIYSLPLTVCNFVASFPNWLPLDKWIPQIFVALNDCSIHQWQFLTLEMSQWLILIFGIYLITALLILISQLYKLKKLLFMWLIN